MSFLFEITKKRPVLVSMIFLIIEFLGLVSFYQSNFFLFPIKTFPGLTINVDYPGADANKIEKLITTPIEEVTASVGGILEVRSFTETGKVKLNIQFQNNVDLDFKNLELKERIELIASGFPRESRKPTVFKYDPEQVPILIYNLKSDTIPLDEIRELVDKSLKPELENIEGVSQVLVAGGKNREILVSCDKLQLESYKISLREVLSTIQSNNKMAGIANVEKNNINDKVYSDGKLRDIFQIRNLAIYTSEKTNVTKIEDIAKVSIDFRDEDNSSRINGQETVGIYIYKTYSGNPLEISEEVNKNILKFNQTNLVLLKSYDLAETIQQAFLNLIFSISLGILIALYFLFYLTRSKKIILIHLLVIVSSFFYSMLVFRVFEINFNILTVSGIILGLCIWTGKLSLLFIADRNLTLEEKYEKNLKNYTLLSFLLLSSALALRPVEIENAKNLFFIIISALIYFWITFISFPILFILLKDKNFDSLNVNLKLPSPIYYRSMYFYYTFEKWDDLRTKPLPIFRLLTRLVIYEFYQFCLKTLELIKNSPNKNSEVNQTVRYGLKKIFEFDSIIEKDLRKRRFFYGIGLILIILYGSYLIFTVEKDSNFSGNKKELIAFVELPSGTGFGHTNLTTKKIEKKLLELRGIEEVMVKTEPAHSLLVLKIAEGVTTDAEYINYLKTSVGNTSPAFLFFSGDSAQGSISEINIDVIGNDLEELDKIVKELNDTAKSMDGVNEVLLRFKPPRDELSLVLDEYRVLKAKLSHAEIGDFLKLAIQGGVATKFILNDRETDVRVRFAEQYRNSERSLTEIRIKNKDNKFIPITDVSKQEESKAPLKIFHKNKRRILSFSIRVLDKSQSEIMEIVEKLKNVKLPENYRLEFDKEFESKESSGKNYLLLLGLIVIFFYMILASYAESFRYPLGKLIYLPAYIAVLFLIQKYTYGRFTLASYLNFCISLTLHLYFIITMEKNLTRNAKRLLILSNLPNLGLFIAFLFFSFGSVIVIFDTLFYYFISFLISLELLRFYRIVFPKLIVD